MARNLKQGRTARLRSAVGVGVIACVFMLALAASAALADGTDPAYPGSVLHVKATGPLTPGSVLTITATGTNALTPFPVHLDYGLDLYLVSADAFQTPCATSEGGEEEISINNSPYVKLLTGDVLRIHDDGRACSPDRCVDRPREQSDRSLAWRS